MKRTGKNQYTIDPVFDARVIALYIEGYSTYRVAHHLRTSQGRVGRILRRLNIQRRTRKEAWRAFRLWPR